MFIMSLEENKAIARRFLNLWGQGDLALVDELATPTFKVFYPYLSEPMVGLEAFKQHLQAFHAIVPDATLVSEDEIIAEGDKVVIRWTARGTYATEMERFPAAALTGKQVTWTGISIFQIVDGKVVEERGEEDYLTQIDTLDLWGHHPQKTSDHFAPRRTT
jgi:steroid delta-isomerase-like uncharacterized protein